MSIINAFPTTIANGQVEDATVVMSLFSWIQSQTNGNACPATTGSAILKGNGSGGTSPAVSGTDYLTPNADFVVTSGTGNAIVASYAVAQTALTDGLRLRFRATATNTAATVITVNALASTPIVNSQGYALNGGEILLGADICITYNSVFAAFVMDTQALAGSLAGFVELTVTTVLTLAQLGLQVDFSGSTAAQTLTLPAIATVPAGKGFYFVNGASVSVTVQANASETISYSLIGSSERSANTLVLGPGDSTFLVSIGTGWTEQQGVRAANVASRQIFAQITPSVGSNALTLGVSGGVLDFRNATLASGPINAGVVIPAATIVVPAAATLGAVSAVQARFVLAVAYNGGTPVLCVANISGGLQMDETNLISPTTISGSATSNAVWYSASAVSANSPYRIVGFVDNTQATAGTYVTLPSLVQGCGGQALTALSSLGYGQTWQSVSRTPGTTYYNTTGKPIVYSGSGVTSASAGGYSLNIAINGGTAFTICGTYSNAAGVNVGGAVIIPAGASYVMTNANISSVISFELR